MQSYPWVRVPCRLFAWCRWLLLLGIAILHLGTVRHDHDWGDDFAQYLAQAACFSRSSFTEFEAETNFRYEHSTDRRMGPKYYPWGYPAILAPVYAWYGLNLVPLKWITTLFLLLSLLALERLFRSQLSDSWRLCLLGLIGFNPAFVAAKEHLLSDLPFLFFAILALWSLQTVFPAHPQPATGFRSGGGEYPPTAARPETPAWQSANPTAMRSATQRSVKQQSAMQRSAMRSAMQQSAMQQSAMRSAMQQSAMQSAMQQSAMRSAMQRTDEQEPATPDAAEAVTATAAAVTSAAVTSAAVTSATVTATSATATATSATSATGTGEPVERASATQDLPGLQWSPARTRQAWLQAAAHAGILGGLLFAACAVRANGIVLVLTTLLIPICRWFSSGESVRGWIRHAKTRRLPVTRSLYIDPPQPPTWLKLTVVFGIFGLLTLTAQLSLPHENSYFEQFALITPGHLFHNLLYYSFLMTLYFSPNAELIGGVVYLLTVPLVLYGLAKRQPGDDVYKTFSLLWLALLIVWPSTRQGLRFLYPLIPIYLYFLFQGVDRLWPSRARGLRPIVWAWSILFLIATLIQLDGPATRGPVEGPYQPDSLELFAWIRREVERQEHVSFFKPRALTLYTGRWAADVADPSDRRAASIRWFVFRLARPETIPQDGADWDEVFRNRTFVVFRRR